MDMGKKLKKPKTATDEANQVPTASIKERSWVQAAWENPPGVLAAIAALHEPTRPLDRWAKATSLWWLRAHAPTKASAGARLPQFPDHFLKVSLQFESCHPYTLKPTEPRFQLSVHLSFAIPGQPQTSECGREMWLATLAACLSVPRRRTTFGKLCDKL